MDRQVAGHHAGGAGSFDVTFSVENATPFALNGFLRVWRAASDSTSFNSLAFVELHGPNGELLINERVLAGSDGVEVVREFDHVGVLDPGEYRVYSQGLGLFHGSAPPFPVAAAGVRLRFEVPSSCSEDLNGDDRVTLEDLSALLADFGCAQGGCAGDVDGDRDTDLDDLARLLQVFGADCAP